MTSAQNTKKSAAGRPSILCREDILNAALELGLNALTMNGIAQHLGAGVSSIYYYFKNRKELIRAAAIHSFSNMSYPKDTGQHWARLVCEYVINIKDNLILNSSFIYGHQLSELGFDVHFRLLEPFLASMHQRGFSEDSAMRLMNAMGMAAFGAAIETIRQNEFKQSGDTMKSAAQRQFGRYDAEAFPHLSKALTLFTSTPDEKLEDMLRLILESFAATHQQPLAEIDLILKDLKITAQ